MSNNIKETLETINEISRQLLSCILSMHQEALEYTAPIVKAESKIKSETNNDKSITTSDMSEMTFKREKLIHTLFEQYPIEKISLELNLLNAMVSLDNELSKQSKIYKKMLSEQVIKLKKSKKVKKSYQKY